MMTASTSFSLNIFLVFSCYLNLKIIIHRWKYFVSKLSKQGATTDGLDVCIWFFFCHIQWQFWLQKGIVLKVWACRLSVTDSVICPLWLTTVLEINYCKPFSKECAVGLLSFSHFRSWRKTKPLNLHLYVSLHAFVDYKML